MFGHRFFMAIEVLCLLLPVSLLFILDAFVSSPASMFSRCGVLFVMLRLLVAVTTASALVAAWVLKVRFVWKGIAIGSAILWTLAFAGLLLAASIGLSAYLPPSPAYECWDAFRESVTQTRLGLLLVVPMVHLLVVRHLAKSRSENM